MAAIGGTYPTTAASVAEWLSALNLSKHEAALTGAGITQVSQLMGLTDEQLIAADIRLVGQRKRLIAASRSSSSWLVVLAVSRARSASS